MDSTRIFHCQLRRSLPKKPAGTPSPVEVGPQEAAAADAAGSERPVQGDVTAPVKLYAPAPLRILETMMRNDVHQKVVLQAIIDEQGCVTEVRVVQRAGLELDRAAAETVTRWVFKPATRDGRPVAVWYQLTVGFRIR